MKLTWRTPVLILGLGIVGIEDFGTVSYQMSIDGGISYLVLGAGAATTLSGFLPHIAERCWHDRQRGWSLFTWLLLPFAILIIILAAIDRTGSTADAKNKNIDDKAQKIELARSAETKAQSAADKLDGEVLKECKTGDGDRCKSLKKLAADAQLNLKGAREDVANEGTKPANSLTRRLTRMLPVTEEQVTLYQPLVLPLVMSALSIVLVAIGMSGPRSYAMPTVEVAKAPRSLPRNVVALRPKEQPVGKVAQFMVERIQPVDGAREEWADLYVGYELWCAESGFLALAPPAFGADLMAFCDKADIGVQRRGSNVYCLDVQLAKVASRQLEFSR